MICMASLVQHNIEICFGWCDKGSSYEITQSSAVVTQSLELANVSIHPLAIYGHNLICKCSESWPSLKSRQSA